VFSENHTSCAGLQPIKNFKMKKSIQKSILALALTALSPSHGKTQIFVEAGLANQAGSAEGSGNAKLSRQSVLSDNGFIIPHNSTQSLIQSGAGGFINPSNVKALGASLITGFHKFFSVNDEYAISLGLSTGYTFLKAQFTPKQVHSNQANTGPGINGAQVLFKADDTLDKDMWN
jgi:hypothetical protein